MAVVSESRTGDQVRLGSPHLGYPYLGEPYLTEGSLTSPAWQGLWAGTVGRIAATVESSRDFDRITLVETPNFHGIPVDLDPVSPKRVAMAIKYTDEQVGWWADFARAQKCAQLAWDGLHATIERMLNDE